MVMVNIIPLDQRLLVDHHHNHSVFDVVNVVASLTMHPPVTVLNVVPDVKFKLCFCFVYGACMYNGLLLNKKNTFTQNIICIPKFDSFVILKRSHE
jgi:hypothetical protein